MKLNKFFYVMLAVALPLGFAACSSDDDDEDSTPYEYPVPAQKANAASFKVKGEGVTTRSVVFTESGNVVLERLVFNVGAKATRANEGSQGYDYLVGTYTKEGNTYTIFINGKEWGTITVTDKGDGTFTLLIQEKSGEPEAVSAEKEPEIGKSSFLDKLCRTWKPISTRVKLKKQPNGTQLTSPLFQACDFETIKQWAQTESDCKISDEFGKDYSVKDIFFTKTGKFCIDFTSGKNYYGTYSWKEISELEGQLNYNWADLETMGCSYENGEATVAFKTGEYKGQCWLNLAADIKSGSDTYHVEVSVHLQ